MRFPAPVVVRRGRRQSLNNGPAWTSLDLIMARVHLSVCAACARRLQSSVGSLEGSREPEAAGGEASGVSPRLPRAAGWAARGVEGDGSVGFGRRRWVGGECGGRAGGHPGKDGRARRGRVRAARRSIGGWVGGQGRRVGVLTFFFCFFSPDQPTNQPTNKPINCFGGAAAIFGSG